MKGMEEEETEAVELHSKAEVAAINKDNLVIIASPAAAPQPPPQSQTTTSTISDSTYSS